MASDLSLAILHYLHGSLGGSHYLSVPCWFDQSTWAISFTKRLIGFLNLGLGWDIDSHIAEDTGRLWRQRNLIPIPAIFSVEP